MQRDVLIVKLIRTPIKIFHISLALGVFRGGIGDGGRANVIPFSLFFVLGIFECIFQ